METGYETPRHDTEMQEIIAAVPSRLLRWGITVMLLVLLLIFGLSAFVHYPDSIKTKLTVHSENLEGKVISPIQGQIVHLLSSPDEEVKAGQSLALISGQKE